MVTYQGSIHMGRKLDYIEKRLGPKEMKEKILSILIEANQETFTGIRNKTGISKNVLARHLRDLKDERKVMSIKKGKNVLYMIPEKAYTYDLTIKAKMLEFALNMYVYNAYLKFENKPDQFVRRLTAVILFLLREMRCGDIIRDQVASKVAKNLLYRLLTQCLHFSDKYVTKLEDTYGELEVVKRLSRPDSLKKLVSTESDKHGSTMISSSSVLDAIESDSS